MLVPPHQRRASIDLHRLGQRPDHRCLPLPLQQLSMDRHGYLKTPLICNPFEA
jgi:hypothetical protein